MEGLIRPVGPEEERTYWVRRGIAAAVLLVLLIGMGSMIGNLGRAESTAAPAEATAVPGPESAVEPAAAPAAADGPPDAVVLEEAVPLPSTAATQSKQAPPEPTAPAAPATSAPAVEQTLPPEPSNTFHQTTPPGSQSAPAQICDAQAIKVGLDGQRQVQAGVPVMFKITVSNGGDGDCAVVIDDKTFELKVSSGNSRVWSSRDCLAAMPPRSAVLAPNTNLEWQLEWLANRSEAPCKTAPEKLSSGTYVATAQLRDARAAQVIMELAG